ncbi:hypothetical protein [Paenibacillus sp. 22594]|uniref:hypothetical protein n=1 Tax=Paenibacillus sp. 22594 TaxID=3453947 RepID=UPI003F82C7E5
MFHSNKSGIKTPTGCTTLQLPAKPIRAARPDLLFATSTLNMSALSSYKWKRLRRPFKDGIRFSEK